MSGLPALAEQNKDKIARLLQNGADINEQDSHGYTALLVACRYYHTEITEILLKYNKINVNLQNNDGWSPFYGACYSDSYECSLMMLQDARVDINMADNIGWSPLIDACYRGHTKIVQLLLSFGRYIDIKSVSTAIDLAKQMNKTNIVQLLQQYQNNPKETQKLWRNQLNLKGKK